MSQVRVRFAPSPTGPLHIGGLRTAFYNYLFAKHHNGNFILRIEDTDRDRYVEGAERYIFNCLEWTGITPDEGPEKGGSFSPYRQSERKDIYKEQAQKLIASGKAYYAFDTPEELDAMRIRLKEEGSDVQHYNYITREQMKNSLTMAPETVKEKIENNDPYVIRLKISENKEIEFEDLIRGRIRVNSSTLDDKILLKSDGLPTYHLANVVDDHLMEVSHVIRGEEWLPSTPLHVLLYDFMGWKDQMPDFAHLPLLLKPEGKGKLSKRDAEKHGFPIFPLNWKDPDSGEISPGFREQGYLPEALLNFLAFLGWNPGTEQEMFSVDELIKAFSIERIGKSGTKFDVNKAKWFNQQYLKQKSDDELGEMLLNELEGEQIQCSKETATRIASLMKERVTFPQELWTEASFFFEAPVEYDEKVIRKKWTPDVIEALKEFKTALSNIPSVHEEDIKSCLEKILTKTGVGMGKVMQVLRVVITGKGGGPDLMPTLSLIGKEEVEKRIETAIKRLENQVKVKNE